MVATGVAAHADEGAPRITAAPERAGYLSPAYAAAFAEFGEPRSLARSGGWLLARPIAGTAYLDAIAGFRRLLCNDWSALADDLGVAADLVSIVGVTDPFAAARPEDLGRAFPDLLRPYKTHFVVELARARPDARHAAKARRAAGLVEIAVTDAPETWLPAWLTVHRVLQARRPLPDLDQGSAAVQRAQFAVPGATAFQASRGGECLAMTLWYRVGEIAYYHLGGSTLPGYEIGASFALFAAAIDEFAARRLRWLDLGSGAGIDHADEGLARFKRGWATATRPTFLGGRINRPDVYRDLVSRLTKAGDSDFFPAYRPPAAAETGRG